MAPTPEPYVHQPYPSHRYYVVGTDEKTGEKICKTMIVHSPEEDEALDKDKYKDTPAAFEPGYKPPPPPPLSVAEAAVKDLTQLLDEANAKVAVLDEQAATLNDTLADRDKDVADLERQLADAKKNSDGKAAEKLKAANETIDAQAAQIKDLEKQLKAATKKNGGGD